MPENHIPIKLPSKCLPYKDVDPSKIAIRTLKGKDEKIISEMSGENFERKFLTLLQNVLVGVDPSVLTLGDRLYLAVWEAMNSYSKEFTLKHECETCWQTSEFTVDLGKINSIDLPDSYKQPYELYLPKSKQTVTLKLLSISDVIKVDELSKAGTNVWLYRYAYGVESPGKNIPEKAEFLEELPTKDLALIRGFHEKFYHGPKMEVSYECPKCGGAGIMPVPFRLEMLFPYGEALTRNFGDAI